MMRRAFAVLFLVASAAIAQQGPALQREFADMHAAGDVESVNTFDGSVGMTIPLGRRYPVSEMLSYQFTLAYTSNVWETTLMADGVTYVLKPLRSSNAGLGWRVAFGRLVLPNDWDNVGVDTPFYYEDSSGKRHKFWSTLHDEELANESGGELLASYTRDNSYLRLFTLKSGATVTGYRIDMPDGTMQYFDTTGKLTQMADRVGGFVNFTYPTSPHRMVLTDSHGRVHTVEYQTFTSVQTNYEKVVNKIRLQTSAVDTNTPTQFVDLEYDFEYLNIEDTTKHPRSANCSAYATGNVLTRVPVLDFVTIRSMRTDNSVQDSFGTYDIATNLANIDSVASPSTHVCHSGMVNEFVQPTLGKVQWTYQHYKFPLKGCRYQEPPEDLHYYIAEDSIAPGAKTRRYVTASGTEEAKWEYFTRRPSASTSSVLCGEEDWFTVDVSSQELRNMTKAPDGNKTVRYFSVWPEENAPTGQSGFASQFYGLPFTSHSSTTLTGGWLLSEERYDCSTGACFTPAETCPNGQTCTLAIPASRSYVKYEHDTGFRPGFEANSRVSATRTDVVATDTACTGSKCTKEVTHSQFDGFGHYRTATTAGTYSGINARTVTTNFNPGITYPGTFSQISPTSSWFPNLFTERTRTENGLTFKEEYHFDSATGLLARQRQRKSTATQNTQDTTDFVTKYERSTEAPYTVLTTSYYGGDLTPVTTGQLDQLTLGTPAYQTKALSRYGALAELSYLKADGTAELRTLKQTIDVRTGLPTSKEAPDTLATTIAYDALGRVVAIDPASTAEPAVGFTHQRATSAAALAKTTMVQYAGSIGGTVLSTQEHQLDSFGRVSQTKRSMPGSTWSYVKTTYNAMGRASTVTVPSVAAPTGSTPVTSYGYDYRGRPTLVTAPDASQTTFSYTGDRVRSRTQVVSGASATTTETYDRFGRLATVVEPAGAIPPGESLATPALTAAYSYDATDRLVGVTLTAAGYSAQSRTFSYDGRGVLKSEQHPERGTRYDAFDALGNPTRQRPYEADGQTAFLYTSFDHKFIYDRAGRVTAVQRMIDANTGTNLKTFTYGSMAGTTPAPLRGKLHEAVRYNRDRFAANTNISVTDTYTYTGTHGNVSSRVTCIGSAPCVSTDKSFTTSWTYEPSGAIDVITYPDLTAPAAAAGTDYTRTVSNDYAAGATGFLTKVTSESGLMQALSITPIAGPPMTAQSITITGTNFSTPNSVTIGGAPATVTGVTSTQITVTTPATLAAGTLNDVVVTINGQPASTIARAYFSRFNDVPASSGYAPFVETIRRNLITGGCGDGTNYCPAMEISHEQMAVFLFVAKYGVNTPRPAVTVAPYPDVNTASAYAPFIQYLKNAGIYGPPNSSPERTVYSLTEPSRPADCATGNFCPGRSVTREEMAILMLRMKYGGSYQPPAATGNEFTDITSTTYGNCATNDTPCKQYATFGAWVEQFKKEGITSGCGGTLFCPKGRTARDQMAVFLVAAFGLKNPRGAISGDINALTYYANGMTANVAHDNGVSDVAFSDPKGMARSRDLRTVGSSQNFLSGIYTYDGAANVLTIGTDQYAYDKVGRLVDGTTQYVDTTTNKRQQFKYDPFGNLAKLWTKVNGTDITGSPLLTNVTPANNRDTTATYDALGSQTSAPGSAAIEYDELGMPRSLTETTGSVVIPWKYFYNANDERVWVQNTYDNTGRYMIRGLNNEVLREFSSAGAVGSESWNGTHDFLYAAGLGSSIKKTPSGLSSYHYHTDHLGTVRLVTNHLAAPVGKHDFYPFGREATDEAQSSLQRRFTSHERDFNSLDWTKDDEQLDYMHARYYSPLLGRFLSVDPIGGNLHAPQSWNRYSYVRNSPNRFIDPTGMLRTSSTERTISGWTGNGECTDDFDGIRCRDRMNSFDVGDGWKSAGDILNGLSRYLGLEGYADGVVGRGNGPFELQLQPRKPDYFSFNLTFNLPATGGLVGAGPQVVITREGHIFVGIGGGVGKSWTGSPASITATAGYVVAATKGASINDYVEGWSIGAGGGAGAGGFVNTNRTGVAVEGGLVTPLQAGINGSYVLDLTSRFGWSTTSW